MADHFAGKKIDFIDVVNEPPRTPPNGLITTGSGAGTVDPTGDAYLNALGGTCTTGYDWISTSFQLARRYFPDAKLVIYEYNIVSEASAAARYVTILNLLKACNLIDRVGLQGQLLTGKSGLAATFAFLPIYASQTPTPSRATDVAGPPGRAGAVHLLGY